MKIIFILLSMGMFLLYPEIIHSQQTQTVEIPGIDTHIYHDGASGYGVAYNHLQVGHSFYY